MRVCHCHGVTDKEITQAERAALLGRCPGRGALAGSACGGCRPLVEHLRDKERAAMQACGPAASNAA